MTPDPDDGLSDDDSAERAWAAAAIVSMIKYTAPDLLFGAARSLVVAATWILAAIGVRTLGPWWTTTAVLYVLGHIAYTAYRMLREYRAVRYLPVDERRDLLAAKRDAQQVRYGEAGKRRRAVRHFALWTLPLTAAAGAALIQWWPPVAVFLAATLLSFWRTISPAVPMARRLERSLNLFEDRPRPPGGLPTPEL